MNALKDFFAAPKNSRSREYLLTTRLVHDLGVAAAAHNYDLLVYLPTVDRDGFDVIFDDRDRLVPMQLKSVIKEGQAAGWDVHRRLIRPERENADLYGFEFSDAGTGRGGGVVLTTVSPADSEVNVHYAYTDIDVLTALWLGLIRRPQPQKKRLERLRAELHKDICGGRVSVPRSAFVNAASPEHLLALAGLHSRIQSNWRLQLQMLLRHVNLRADVPVPREALCRSIAAEIAKLESPRSWRGPE